MIIFSSGKVIKIIGTITQKYGKNSVKFVRVK